MINDKKLFLGSCFALITTALSFALRAGVLPQLEEQLSLSAEQLGRINSMWFFGFPIAMIVGGLVYHTLGGKRIMQFAFISHALGIVLTIYAGSYMGLMVATFLIGLGNGCTEAACNPMIADTYEGNKMSKMMNRFHMWFPGGIVIGAIVSFILTNAGVAWQIQMSLIMIPTIIYAYLFWGEEWPKAKVAEGGNLKGNLKAMISPLFIFMLVCMWFTAQSEFGPTQWVELILKSSGAHPMLVLALITGTMAIARFFGGEVVHKFNTTGVLLGSAMLATLGLFLFTQITGPAVYGVAIIFALGVAYFWPNMIGFVADYIPKSGALGMSIVGAVGMLSSYFMQPIIGRWIDGNRTSGAADGLSGDSLELFVGQETIGTMMFFPILLIGLFTILYFWMKGTQSNSQKLTD
ncbi:MAG: MFS family permease [Saprospiraceae bacterium]|jgi:MFS family permease